MYICAEFVIANEDTENKILATNLRRPLSHASDRFLGLESRLLVPAAWFVVSQASCRWSNWKKGGVAVEVLQYCSFRASKGRKKQGRNSALHDLLRWCGSERR